MEGRSVGVEMEERGGECEGRGEWRGVKRRGHKIWEWKGVNLGRGRRENLEGREERRGYGER